MPYKRPVGWFRKAINVTGKHENMKWIGTGAGPEVWNVGYHGTKQQNANSILKNSLMVGGTSGVPDNGAVLGRGIYLSPDINVAAHPQYSVPVRKGEHTYQLVFQVRVRQGSFNQHRNGSVWVVGNPAEVRPYGILLREVNRAS